MKYLLLMFPCVLAKNNNLDPLIVHNEIKPPLSIPTMEDFNNIDKNDIEWLDFN